MASLFELLVTIMAGVWLLSSVISTMCFQIATFFERFVTIVTDKRLFTFLVGMIITKHFKTSFVYELLRGIRMTLLQCDFDDAH